MSSRDCNIGEYEVTLLADITHYEAIPINRKLSADRVYIYRKEEGREREREVEMERVEGAYRARRGRGEERERGKEGRFSCFTFTFITIESFVRFYKLGHISGFPDQQA